MMIAVKWVYVNEHCVTDFQESTNISVWLYCFLLGNTQQTRRIVPNRNMSKMEVVWKEFGLHLPWGTHMNVFTLG